MEISTQRAVLEAEIDEVWESMEKLFEERQTSSPECWQDIDFEYIELEGLYHKLLAELTRMNTG